LKSATQQAGSPRYGFALVRRVILAILSILFILSKFSIVSV
jgi:hypothetical protein